MLYIFSKSGKIKPGMYPGISRGYNFHRPLRYVRDEHAGGFNALLCTVIGSQGKGRGGSSRWS
jgi:hypothetical protein